MKISKKLRMPILIILLITILLILLKTLSDHERLQTKIDMIYTNSIMDSMDGLSKNFDKLDNNDKVQYYYKVLFNLKDAIDVFHDTSYKQYDQQYQTLYRMYSYLLENQNESYYIKYQLIFYKTLGKLIANPNDNLIIEELNQILD